MPHNTQFPAFLKPEPKRPVAPPRQPVRKCLDWHEYRRTRAHSTSSPGPASDADTKGALEFAREQMPPDLVSVYLEDVRRGRRP